MGTTKIWAIKDSLSRVLDYAANPHKTIYSDLRNVLHYAGDEAKTGGVEKACFVTGVNCSAVTAFDEMRSVQERFGKTTGNVAYHAYQSFKTDEVTRPSCVIRSAWNWQEKCGATGIRYSSPPTSIRAPIKSYYVKGSFFYLSTYDCGSFVAN